METHAKLNRFGFSAKKPENFHTRPKFAPPSTLRKRPSDGGPLQQIQNGMEQLRTSNFGSASSIKYGSFAPRTGSNVLPSTTKSLNRVMTNSYGTAAKNSIGQKLQFGMTPMRNRSSFMNNPASTSRLSRGSTARKGENRLLSDPDYIRECQEKIYQFLKEHDFPIGDRQALRRPSMSDIGKIFEFLFQTYIPNIEIKTGRDTSIDVIVPRCLAFLGYGQTLKKSDLTSCSGGRQMGAIFSALVYLIDLSSFTTYVVADNLISFPFDDEENMEDVQLKLAQLLIDQEEQMEECSDEQSMADLEALAIKLYGSEQDLQAKELEGLELDAELVRVKKELECYLNLPKQIEEKKETIERSENHTKELNESLELHKKAVTMFEDEIVAKGRTKDTLGVEKERLKMQADSQKDIRIQYRLALQSKRSKQTEGDKLRQRISQVSDDLVELTIETNDCRRKVQGISGDFLSVLTDCIAKMHESAKDFPKLGEILYQNRRWSELMDKISNTYGNSEASAKAVLEASLEVSNKFLEMVNALVLVLIGVNSEGNLGNYELKRQFDSKQAELDKLQHELATNKADFKEMTTTFDEERNRQALGVRELDGQINQLQTRVQEFQNTRTFSELLHAKRDWTTKVAEQEAKNAAKVNQNEQALKARKEELHRDRLHENESFKTFMAQLQRNRRLLLKDSERMEKISHKHH